VNNQAINKTSITLYESHPLYTCQWTAYLSANYGYFLQNVALITIQSQQQLSYFMPIYKTNSTMPLRGKTHRRRFTIQWIATSRWWAHDDV